MVINMRKGKRLGIAFLVTASLMLTACGASIPDMTEEENAQVVEYAAGLLLKYDENYHSRLVEEPEVENQEQQEPVNNVVEINTDKSQAEAEIPQAETAVVDARETKVVAENRSIEEFYGIEGIEIRYNGYELKDLYPDNDAEDMYLAMSATSGCKLLILNFEVNNTSGQDINLDMGEMGAKFKISINGEAPRYALTTMLTNDLSSFIGTIAAGASENLILVGEIPDEKAGTIQSVSLSMKNVLEDATTLLN